jgi:hypothetical protein
LKGLTYTAETWTWTRADINKLIAAKVSLLRYIEGTAKTDTRRNKQMRQNMKINTLKG